MVEMVRVQPPWGGVAHVAGVLRVSSEGCWNARPYKVASRLRMAMHLEYNIRPIVVFTPPPYRTRFLRVSFEGRTCDFLFATMVGMHASRGGSRARMRPTIRLLPTRGGGAGARGRAHPRLLRWHHGCVFELSAHSVADNDGTSG